MMDKRYHDKVMKSLTILMEMHDLDVSGFSERCEIAVERLESFIAGEKDFMVSDLVAVVRAFNLSFDYIIENFPFPISPLRADKKREYFEKIINTDQKQLDMQT